MPVFTKDDIEAWKRYEEVRLSGAFNMWSPQVAEVANLTKAQHLFIIKYYDDLQKWALDEVNE